eukprot:4269376-Karenia_brevis.AAC.1
MDVCEGTGAMGNTPHEGAYFGVIELLPAQGSSAAQPHRKGPSRTKDQGTRERRAQGEPWDMYVYSSAQNARPLKLTKTAKVSMCHQHCKTC